MKVSSSVNNRGSMLSVSAKMELIFYPKDFGRPLVQNFLKGSFRDTLQIIHITLENVSTANTLQLEAARRRAVPMRFNFVARANFEVAHLSVAVFAAYTLSLIHI